MNSLRVDDFSLKQNLLAIGLLFALSCTVQADNNINHWEIGAGVSYFSSPHYLGSDQSSNYILPYPHVILKSDVFNVDRSSIEGKITKSNFFKIDVSFSGRLKVDSDDNRAREGMPDLEYVLEAGPSFKFMLHENVSKNHRISFDLPVRAAIATDFQSAEGIGWKVVPTIHVSNFWRGSQLWELDTQFRYLYGSEKYHEYFYKVDAQYATADRAEYSNVEQGAGGLELKMRLKTSYKNMVFGVFVLYSDVSSAVFADSPLVVTDTNFSGGVFVSWIFAKKKSRLL